MKTIAKRLGLAVGVAVCLVAFQNCGSSKSARGGTEDAGSAGTPLDPTNPGTLPEVPDASCADTQRAANATSCLTPAAENQVNSGQCLKQTAATTVAGCAVQCGTDRASGYSFVNAPDAGQTFCYCVYGPTGLQPIATETGQTGFVFQSNACR